MDLIQWQSRLDKHFRTLREQRTDDLGEQPVFALEHDLGKSEIESVSNALLLHVRDASPLWDHRLPWIVYATELGYAYAGDEYWQTFEKCTPGWTAHEDRHWIRRCFSDFQKQYGGAEPTGRWAQHFSIICWPITHAILPQDLQRQFAKLLYELRNRINSEILASPRSLGQLIASYSWNTSSRFQQLAEEPLLLGQIAAALLLQDDDDSPPLILPSTLYRISADLDRERRARVWMKGARDTARRSLQFRGLPKQQSTSSDNSDSDQSAGINTEILALEPRLMLQPSIDQVFDWDVRVEIPDFSHVSSKFPGLRAILHESRVRVVGSSGRWQAPGWLLYGEQSIRLQQWPNDNDVLLEFERSTAELEYILKTECLLRPGPHTLLKITSDGMAYALRTTQIRPGQKYVLLRREKFDISKNEYVKTVRVNCQNVYALFLDLPDAIPRDLETTLADLGLSQMGTIQIWPTGLSPAKWDGETGVEWLNSDIPCIGIQSNLHVDTFAIELRGQRIEAVPPETGAPVFVELGSLPVGRHTLRVSIYPESDRTSQEQASLEIRIREPRIWSPDGLNQSALLVVVDPYAPSLEQFWEGNVDIEIHGPQGRNVVNTIRLYKKGSSHPHFSKNLEGLNLPVTRTFWRQKFEQLKNTSTFQFAYDLASRGEVRFDADEVGAYTLTLERELEALRWGLHRTRDGYFLRVVDDTGTDSEVAIQYFAFATPDNCQEVNVLECFSSDGIRADPGLYVARTRKHRRAILIPKGQIAKARSLTDLRVDPQIRLRSRRGEDLMELIQLLDLWASARLTGDLFTQTMRRQILESLSRQFFGLVCGRRWASVEQAVESGKDDAGGLAKRVMSSDPSEASLASVLMWDATNFANATTRERVELLADLAIRRSWIQAPSGSTNIKLQQERQENCQTVFQNTGPDNPLWLCEFALRLASWPGGFLDWAGNHIHAGLSRLLETPALARAARLLVLIVNRQLGSVDGAGFISIEWTWE